MSDQVLSDLNHCPEHIEYDGECEGCCWHDSKTHEVVAALAQRSGVDLEALVSTAAKATHCCCRQVSEEEWDHDGCLQHCQYPMIEWDAAAAALRLALATAEARHAERERVLRILLADLVSLADDAMQSANKDGAEYDRKAELSAARRALGLEG